MDALDRVAVALEHAAQPLGVGLAADEDQGRAELLVEQRQDAGFLVLRLDQVEPVLDAGSDLALGLQVDAHRVAHDPLHQPLDRRRHGGGEEHRLALARHVLEDALHLGQEAEIEHVVGLVEHQLLDLVELDVAALEVVIEPAGSCDHHVDATAQVVDLRFERNAADQTGGAQAVSLAEQLEEGLGLEGDLTGRGQDQTPHAAAVEEPFGDRKTESGGLSRTGLGEAENVPAFERRRDHRRLDGRRMEEPNAVQDLHRHHREPQAVEIEIGSGDRMLRNRPRNHSRSFYPGLEPSFLGRLELL